MADDKKKKEELKQEDLENVNGGIGIGIGSKKDETVAKNLV